MSHIDTQANPFQAPESVPAQVRLAQDTQFLISDDFILCDADARLPAVCIFTGAQTGLERCTGRVSWYPRWVQLLRILSVFMLLMSLPAIFEILESAGARPMREEEMVAVGIVAVAVFSFGLGLLVRQPVSMEWYVATSVLRSRRNQRILLATIFGLLVLTVLIVGSGFGVAWIVVLPVFFLGLAIFRFVKQPIRPGIITRRDGLYVIGGMKKPFMRRVHQMIDDYNSSTPEERSRADARGRQDDRF